MPSNACPPAATSFCVMTTWPSATTGAGAAVGFGPDDFAVAVEAEAGAVETGEVDLIVVDDRSGNDIAGQVGLPEVLARLEIGAKQAMARALGRRRLGGAWHGRRRGLRHRRMGGTRWRGLRHNREFTALPVLLCDVVGTRLALHDRAAQPGEP